MFDAGSSPDLPHCSLDTHPSETPLIASHCFTSHGKATCCFIAMEEAEEDAGNQPQSSCTAPARARLLHAHAASIAEGRNSSTTPKSWDTNQSVSIKPT